MIRTTGLAVLTALLFVGCADRYGTTSQYSTESSIYYPTGKVEFVFIEKDDRADYTTFCESASLSACEPLTYSKYEGMRGFFVGSETIKSLSREYAQMELQNGSTLYYDVTGFYGVFGDKSQIRSVAENAAIEKSKREASIEKARMEKEKRLQEARQEELRIARELAQAKAEEARKAALINEPLVQGSKIMLLEKAKIHRANDAYKLSNGETHFKDKVEKIRAITKRVKNRVAVAEHLLGIGYISHEEFDDVYFLDPYSEFESYFSLAFSVSNGVFYPRFYVQYKGDDWIFANHYVLKADDRKWTYSGQAFDHKNTAWDVTEYSQRIANSNDVERIKILANADIGMVKVGGKYDSSFKINEEGRERLKWSVKLYELTR